MTAAAAAAPVRLYTHSSIYIYEMAQADRGRAAAQVENNNLLRIDVLFLFNV